MHSSRPPGRQALSRPTTLGCRPSQMHEKGGKNREIEPPWTARRAPAFRPCGSNAVLRCAVLALARDLQRRLEGVRCVPRPGTMVSGTAPPSAAQAGDARSSLPGRTRVWRWGSGISSQRAMGLAPGSVVCPDVGQGHCALNLSMQSRHQGSARRVLSFESLPPAHPNSAATWGPGADLMRSRCINACGRWLTFGQLVGWSPTQGRRPLR